MCCVFLSIFRKCLGFLYHRFVSFTSIYFTFLLELFFIFAFIPHFIVLYSLEKYVCVQITLIYYLLPLLDS